MRFRGFVAIVGIWMFGVGRCLALDCTPLEPQAGTNLSKEAQGEIDANLSGLLSKLGGAKADIDGAFKASKTDTLMQYNNNSEQYRWERLVFLKCEMLSESTLSDSEKSKEFDDLFDKSLAPPPESMNKDTTNSTPIANIPVLVPTPQTTVPVPQPAARILIANNCENSVVAYINYLDLNGKWSGPVLFGKMSPGHVYSRDDITSRWIDFYLYAYIPDNRVVWCGCDEKDSWALSVNRLGGRVAFGRVDGLSTKLCA